MYTCPELEFDIILEIDACRELDYVRQRGLTGKNETRIGDLEKVLTETKEINDRTEDNCVKRIDKEGVWKRYKSKKLSREEKEALDNYLTEMMEKEFIKRVNTPTSSNKIMVRKPDNSFRLCVDYRYLNGITVDDVYPMPDVSTILERMKGYKIYSKTNLKNAYYSVRMSQELQALMSFTCDRGTFCFRVKPLGLKNAPSIFQRYMGRILGRLRMENIAIYLNDILIGNMKNERHIIEVNRVVSQLLKQQLSVMYLLKSIKTTANLYYQILTI
jgi:Reverse transcriptase (RNA-dependent DNA polymerase)